jgi:hypothetical protein
MIFVGVDWAEAHHDVQDENGKRLGGGRLPEGVDGIARSHELVGNHVDEPSEVVVGIETDRGLFVSALVGTGYQVFAVNPMSTSRYRDRHSTSGAKSDPGDAKVLADMVRTDRHNHRVVSTAMGASVAASVAVIATMSAQIAELARELKAGFELHPDAQVVRSLPGLGTILGARVLGEFGDEPDRYATAKSRKNYAGTSPITRASGTKKAVLARHVRNRRLADASYLWAFSALVASPGARALYDQHRAAGDSHHAALRALGNRLVGILHGCLHHHTLYDETVAWGNRQERFPRAA